MSKIQNNRRRRCDVMVRAGTCRAPGQCQKRHGLKRVKLADTTILVCAHHSEMLGRGVSAERVA